MSESKIKELQLDIAELKALQEKSTRSRVRDVISVQVRRLETELVDLKDKLKAETPIKTKEATTKPSDSVKRVMECQLKDYSWDQSEKFVKLYLTGLNGVDKCPQENIKIEYTNESVNLRVGPFSEQANKVFTFGIKKTCHMINPDKSYHKAKSDYLAVFLAKHNPGSDWSHITYAEKIAAESKKKSEEPKMDDNADPSAGIMNMMKKMYQDGDDEMKRTIAKAWTEGQDKKTPMPM